MSWRYELKLVAPAHALASLRLCLQQHPESFRRQHEARQVNSLYFDTPHLGAYLDNLLGSNSRHKLRLRWYGPQHTLIKGHLELKRKRNMLGRQETAAAA